MNRVKKAKNYFHGTENYNCAQAVLKAFQEEYQVSDEMIEQAKAYGAGRCESGKCGALFAALQILKDDPTLQAQLEKDFLDQVGAVHCREIRKEDRMPCRECVAIAAELLDERTPSA